MPSNSVEIDMALLYCKGIIPHCSTFFSVDLLFQMMCKGGNSLAKTAVHLSKSYNVVHNAYYILIN